MTARTKKEPEPEAAARPAEPGSLPKATDLGNSERLVREHGKDLRFVKTWGKWFEWDEKTGLWREDDTGEIARKMRVVVKRLYIEASNENDDEIRKGLVKFALKSESRQSITNAIALAESDRAVAIRPEQFDRDPWLFNAANCVVNLRTGGVRPHERGDLCTKSSAIEYREDASCPRFLRFLEEVFLGRKDLIAFVQRAVGYSLTGQTGEHAVFIAHGNGSNGKSTFFEALRPVLGGYATNIEAASLLVNGRDGAPRNDIARLVGARMVTAAEVGEGKRLDESMIKALTGGDRVTARFLRQEFFEFTPQFKVWMSANHKPIIRGTDNGIWRRLKLLPFDASFPPAARDLTLPATLREEASGILRWAIDGCLAWNEDGLGSCDVVEAATASYREAQDVIGSFLKDRCSTGMMFSDTGARLYAAFRSWAEKNGEYPLRNRDFAAALEDRGIVGKRTETGKRWQGVMVIRQENEPETDG